MICGWEDCGETAVEVLAFVGQLGHVHNCRDHARFNREWSDVEESAPVLGDDSCPWPCTPEPIHTTVPTPLSETGGQ